MGSATALACGGARETDFSTDDGAAGEASGSGGTAGSAQGGSAQGGSAQGGASGSGGATQGGSTGNGGSPSGGTGNGGASGTETGGATTGGAGGTDPVGGSGGELGGTGPGGAGGTMRGGSGGQGGDDCATTIANAQAALLAAEVCVPGIDAPQCTGSVKDLCDCSVPVNDPDSDATKSYLSQREAAMKCHPVCLAVVCREPTTALCGIGGATTNIVVAQAHCTWAQR